MATLVLTTVGSVLGGPIGGAIGALAGQAIDSAIFKPKGRSGPRLADLQVQTSRYGARIPAIFGTMRVAGTVIWSTDLQETGTTSSSGKGRPSLTSYSYAASFAVALSSRPILGVGRIWADGNLLRGAGGDVKTPLGALRIHEGGAGQAVDPLIAAAQGIDQTPACRDLAYVVFEDLQLADFGNRIPSLTFEVTADDGGVAVCDIAADLLARPVSYVGAGAPAVSGFSADGEDAGDALAPLVDSYGLRWRQSGAVVALAEPVASGRILSSASALRAIDGREEPPGARQRETLEDVPARLSIRHFDQARDYQPGVQSAQRAGPGRRSVTIDLPAVVSADGARALADRSLRVRLRARQRYACTAGWAALDLVPGDVVMIEGDAGHWAVDSLEWDDMAPRLRLRACLIDPPAGPVTGDSGQAVLPPDLVQGETRLVALELPALDDVPATAPLVFAAATGATAGWRQAALFRHFEDVALAQPAGVTAPRAVIGTALGALPAAAPWTIDLRSAVEVQLINAADSLVAVDDEALLRGANLCQLGDELLQFGHADLIGPGRYRLSRFLRGGRGTEWAMDGHAPDDAFVLIDAERLARIDTSAADIGRVIELRASGLGDSVPAEAQLGVDGRAMLPPAPVHGVVSPAGGGDLQIGWTRRSRLGWSWRDLSDAPLGEEREAYRLAIVAGTNRLRETELSAPLWIYSAADQLADMTAAGGAARHIELRQIGTYGPSWPLVIALP